MEQKDDIRQLKVFIAYSREDNADRERLEKHLSTLKRNAAISTWYDGKIEAGKDWEREIKDALNLSDIILLLISPDFIDSDYCYNVEMSRALERHEAGDATVIPIIVRHCDWEDTPFSKIQLLPRNGQPLNSAAWPNRDEAFAHVCKEIKSIVQNVFTSRVNTINEYNEKIIQLNLEIEELKKNKIDMMAEEEKQKAALASQLLLINSELDKYNKMHEFISKIENYDIIIKDLNEAFYGLVYLAKKYQKYSIETVGKFIFLEVALGGGLMKKANKVDEESPLELYEKKFKEVLNGLQVLDIRKKPVKKTRKSKG